ncbi:hypothetical protein ACQPZQ_17465 [Pseudonocardia sp. CA-142604]|uniref:hypothetical protein n=1 Tax=Pseudonocardia sp. CA-142604 TaxID=3240024 RepID=UPI003D8E5DA1
MTGIGIPLVNAGGHSAPAGFNDYPAQPVQRTGDSPDFCDRSRRRTCDETYSENVKRTGQAAAAVAVGKELSDEKTDNVIMCTSITILWYFRTDRHEYAGLTR